MITIVQAAEIADRLWWTNRHEFYFQCAIARSIGTTLLELIRQRAEILRGPYETYEVTELRP